jgi:hypothetical protein
MDKQLAALNGHKGGRSKSLSKSSATLICNTLANSTESLRSLCSKHPEWPSYCKLDHYRNTHDWFKRMIADARARQADFLVTDNHDISAALLAEPEPSMARVQARRIVMEDRRWYASKVLRRMYGDDPTVQVANVAQVQVSPDQLRDLRKRLERIREAEHGSQGAGKSPPQVP